MCKTDVNISKIDGTVLPTYDIAVTNFFLQDRYKKDRIFEKIFLLANISIEIVLGLSLFYYSRPKYDLPIENWSEKVKLLLRFYILKNV